MDNKKGITDEQVVEALRQCKNNASEAAKLLGCQAKNLRLRREKLVKRGLWGTADSNHLVPKGYLVKGKSVLYGQDGNPVMQWVKSDLDKERMFELLQQAVDALKDEIPRFEKTELPETSGEHLLNLYVLTDYHLGMMAWSEETGGDDWDLKKAEALLIAWIDNAIERAPKAEIAILGQLGDLLHWDGMDAVTPASKNILDADTRFQKVVRMAIRLIRYIITRLLTKYRRVRLIQTGGNHDPASTVWLREFFAAFYEDEPRVEVDNGADSYFCYEFGNTSLFFNHFDKRTAMNIDQIFTAKFRDVFGRTKYSYAHGGHRHNKLAVESALMIVEQHRTLAPKDAYAAKAGYESGREATVITYHKDFGEVGRIQVNPNMLK
jgi:hypothetical protein